jgi:hypothetical protein
LAGARSGISGSRQALEFGSCGGLSFEAMIIAESNHLPD